MILRRALLVLGGSALCLAAGLVLFSKAMEAFDNALEYE